MIYFGDTAHLPWGDKSTQAIQHYALKICELLLAQHCKAIVIACHTASTAACELIRSFVGDRALVIDVIHPIVQQIKMHHGDKKIGLIGTKQTIHSNAYRKHIELLGQNTDLRPLATPLLVPLIEEGFSNSKITEMLVAEYLSNPLLAGIEALILGCTHYPLIKNHIQNFYTRPVDIIDASETTALLLKETLEKHALLNTQNIARKSFYISDYNEFFAENARLFFQEAMTIEHYPLWD